MPERSRDGSPWSRCQPIAGDLPEDGVEQVGVGVDGQVVGDADQERVYGQHRLMRSALVGDLVRVPV
jgi:hypothetical protein